MSKPRAKTNWHLLLGRLLSLALEPLNVQVQTEVQLLSEAPKVDIVLLRRDSPLWTAEQRRWLADGLRHVDAAHLLLEFKYSEGLTFAALRQLNAYDYFYCESKKRPLKDVACFLAVASTPQGDWQGRFGFIKTAWRGVYQGTGAFAERVQVLLLNELDPTPHNAPLKCFATRRQERNAAFAVVDNSDFEHSSVDMEQLVLGLRRIFMPRALSTEDLTPDRVMEMGRELIEAMTKAVPIGEFLSRHSSDEIFKYYKPEQRLAGLTEEQRLAGLTGEQRLAGLSEEQILAYLAQLRKSSS